jgi:hypothetical protein
VSANTPSHTVSMPAFQRMSREEISLASHLTGCILCASFSIKRDAQASTCVPSHDYGHACECVTKTNFIDFTPSCLPQTRTGSRVFLRRDKYGPWQTAISSTMADDPKSARLFLLTLSTWVQSNGSPPCMDAMLLFMQGMQRCEA